MELLLVMPQLPLPYWGATREMFLCFNLYLSLLVLLWIPISLNLISGQFTRLWGYPLTAFLESCVIAFHTALRLIPYPSVIIARNTVTFAHSERGYIFAPSPIAILRCNRRAVPVLSFLSQFVCPPVNTNIPEHDQWSVHKMSRIPSNCMSRKLCHNVPYCIEVDPISLSDYCKANSIRFAHSEWGYILNLRAQVISFRSVCSRQDVTPLFSVRAPACLENLFDVQKGHISDPPLLFDLLHALKLSCVSSEFKSNCIADSSRSWVVDYPFSVPCDTKSVFLQM